MPKPPKPPITPIARVEGSGTVVKVWSKWLTEIMPSVSPAETLIPKSLLMTTVVPWADKSTELERSVTPDRLIYTMVAPKVELSVAEAVSESVDVPVLRLAPVISEESEVITESSVVETVKPKERS